MSRNEAFTVHVEWTVMSYYEFIQCIIGLNCVNFGFRFIFCQCKFSYPLLEVLDWRYSQDVSGVMQEANFLVFLGDIFY